MKHCDPFNFNFGIKFVNVNGGDNNLTIAQTGDALGWIIAAVLAIIAIGAFAFYAAKKRNAKMNISSQIASHAAAAKASVASSISSKIVLGLAVVALALSGIAFASQSVKAFAEGSTPVIKAVVADDGSISVKPIHLTNAKNTDIKFVCTTADLWGEKWGDETLAQSIISMDFGGQSLYNSVPDGHEQLNDDIVNRIPQGEAADIAVNISNLDGEYAKSLIGETVYYCGFKFEDAVVPVPSHTDYFIYNNEWFSTLDTEVTDDSPYYWDTASQYHEKEACDRVPELEDTLTVPADDPVPGDPIPYLATLKLKNAYVWEAFDEVDPDTGVSKRIAPGVDPYTWEWVIDQRTISIEWAPDTTSLVYDGKAHPPIPTLGNAADPQVLSANFWSTDPDELDVYYQKYDEECTFGDVIDVALYSAILNTFKVAPAKGEATDPNLVKNYKLEDNTFRALQITPKELGVNWDAVDAYHEYDSAPYTPKCTLDGICSRFDEETLDTIPDDVSLTYTYFKLGDDGSWTEVSDNNPTQVGTYKAEIALDLTQGDETFCYSLPENCSFEFQIEPVPGDSLLINWPKTTEYVATRDVINPIPTSVEGLKGEDDANIDGWSYAYFEIDAEGNETLVDDPDTSLIEPGKYVVYAAPVILNGVDDVTSCYRFNEDQKVYTFEVVKPSFKLDWSAYATAHTFDNTPYQPIPVITAFNWPDASATFSVEVAYKDSADAVVAEPTHVGSYVANVTTITDGDKAFSPADCDLIPEGSDTFNFEITPAALSVSWTNLEPEMKSTDYIEDARDQVFDYVAHGKVATLAPVDMLSGFFPVNATLDYYTVIGMSESKMGSGVLPTDAGSYKAAISTWTAPGGFEVKDFVLDPADSSYYYNITKRPFAGVKVTLKAENEDVAYFDPDTNTYEYDDQEHFPLIEKLTDSIEYNETAVDKDLAPTDYYISSSQEPKLNPGNYSMTVQSWAKNYETGTINVPWSIASYESNPKLYWGYVLNDAVETNAPEYTFYLSPVKVPGKAENDDTDSLLGNSSHPPAWFDDPHKSEIKTIYFWRTSLNTKIVPISQYGNQNWFDSMNNCNDIKNLDLLDLSCMTHFETLFNNLGCNIDPSERLPKLCFLEFSNNVASICSKMLQNSNIEIIDLSKVNFTNNSLICTSMFENCRAKEITMPNTWSHNDNGSNKIFLWCANLEVINGLENCSKCDCFVSMFQNCSKLKNLNLSVMNNLSSTNCANMFEGANKLEKLVLPEVSGGLLTSDGTGLSALRNTLVGGHPCWFTEKGEAVRFDQTIPAGTYYYDRPDVEPNVIFDELKNIPADANPNYAITAKVSSVSDSSVYTYHLSELQAGLSIPTGYKIEFECQKKYTDATPETYYFDEPTIKYIYDGGFEITADVDSSDPEVYKVPIQGNDGQPRVFTPDKRLNFAITYNEHVDPPLPWEAMQAQIANGTMIDFYPAFSDTSQIAGYKFATYDGTNYHEIININSMSDIYSALQPTPATPGTGTTTLYYYKEDESKPALKCYTVKDLAWSYVFGTGIGSGVEAAEYDPDFIADYQQDNSGNANGIKTALLDDGFGSNWNQTGGSIKPDLVNDVNYTGFYGCYGGNHGGLLSVNSYYAWGCCTHTSTDAYYFNPEDTGSWSNGLYRTAEFGVVLAKEFGGSETSLSSARANAVSAVSEVLASCVLAEQPINASFNIYDVDLPEGEDEITDNENWWNDADEVYVYAENKNEEAFTSNIYAVVQHADGTVTKEYITKDGQPIEVKGDDQTEVCTWTVPEDAVAVVFVYGEIPSDVPADAPAGTPEYYGGSAVEPEDTRGMSEGVAQAPSRVVETPDSNDITIF